MAEISRYMPIIQRARRLYSSLDDARLRAAEILENDPNVTEAQLFNALVSGLGRGKCHMSGEVEGKMKAITHRSKHVARRRY